MNSVRLGDVIKRIRRPVAVEPGVAYRQIGIRSHGKGIFHKEPTSGTDLGSKKIFAIHDGDLVFNIVFAWEGAVAVAGPAETGMCGSHRFPTYRPIGGACDVQYLAECLLSAHGRQLLGLASPGSAGRNRTLNQSALLDLVVPIPSFDQQRRIVDLLQSTDAVIAAATQLSSASASAASRVRYEHFTEHGRTTTPAGEFFEITMGRQRSPRHASGDHIVPYLRAANAKDGRLDLTDVKAMNFSPAEQVKYHLEDGDVLVTEGCGSLDQLGASAQWHAELPGVVCFQNTLLRIRGVEDRSLSDYAFQWARWCFEAGRFAAVASGTNIFHVGAERARAMMAPDVTLVEQREFLDAVEALDRVTSQARSLAARASDLRLAVLADLLSGNHEIPESYDELLESAS